MSERTCLITGGTSGIGLATAGELAARGMRVAIAGRSETRCERAAAAVRRTAPHARVETFSADLESLAAVRALARSVEQRLPRLDVLIANAGLLQGSGRTTADGFEVTFAVNHLAHFLLTALLTPLLRASAPARVVVVSSALHHGAPLLLADLRAHQEGLTGWSAYQQSKLANLLFSFELARRLAGSGVTANALHPGLVRTAIGRQGGLGVALPMAIGGALFGLSPRRGARTSVYLASAPELEGVTGRYFVRCKPREPSPHALDTEAAGRLWEPSERAVGLGGCEPEHPGEPGC